MQHVRACVTTRQKNAPIPGQRPEHYYGSACVFVRARARARALPSARLARASRAHERTTGVVSNQLALLARAPRPPGDKPAPRYPSPSRASDIPCPFAPRRAQFAVAERFSAA